MLRRIASTSAPAYVGCSVRLSSHRHEPQIVYQPLTRHHRDAACMAVARAFTHEPTTIALGKVNPKSEPSLIDWVAFVDPFMEDACHSGMSVVAIDTANHCVAGVELVRDSKYFPDGWVEQFCGPDSRFFELLECLEGLDAEAMKAQECLRNAKEKEVADFWMGAVIPGYRGQRILNGLLENAKRQTKHKGFKYAIGECTGAFSTRATKSVGFKSVATFDCNALYKGKYPAFELPHPHTGVWNYMMNEL